MTAKSTPDGKKVKTHFMSWSLTGTAGLADTLDGADEYIFQDDVRVIGCQVRAWNVPLAELDSGRIEAKAEVSRIGKWFSDGRILEAVSYQEGRSVTVAAGSTETLQGPYTEAKEIMFPEGYGIDFNEGDAIYLNAYWFNSMANDHVFEAQATIYFVER